MGTALTIDLDGLLADQDTHVRDELKNKPEVVDVGHELNLDDLAITVRRWHRVTDVVAVVIDLQNSTQLDLNKHPGSTASIYEAAIHPAVKIFSTFGADDIDIQGDGVIGLFWGDGRYNRAIAAAITIKTFSEKSLVERLNRKPNWTIDTGFKVGIASSSLLAKRIGLARTNHQEEVWPGKAVNYAAKAAQNANAHEMIITKTVWEKIENNQWLTWSCSCFGGPTHALWDEKTISRLRDDEPQRDGRILRSAWCDTHGAEFCQAILDGKTKRTEVEGILARQGAA